MYVLLTSDMIEISFQDVQQVYWLFVDCFAQLKSVFGIGWMLSVQLEIYLSC